MNLQLKHFKTICTRLYYLDKVMVLALLILAGINILVQYSANDRMFSHVINDIIYLIISFILLLIVANLNLGQLKHLAIPLYLASLILLLAVLLFGVKLHGATRWLNLGIRLQPSELCKLSVPLIVAYYFSLKPENLKSFDYMVGFLLILLPFLLIAKQPDLGTALLVFAAGFFVLFFADLPWRVIVIAAIILIASIPLSWHFLHDYQQHRILTLLHPQLDPLGTGYHVTQGIIAIGSGGLFGKGYLHGTQIHLDFIPEKHTDFVIAVLAEEFGYLGICAVLMLYLILIVRALTIIRGTHDFFARVLAGSITLSFTLVILINMGMVAGLLPVVGVPLPFISYGGTAMIVLALSFGILLAVSRQNKY